jgi:hypothetical protein
MSTSSLTSPSSPTSIEKNPRRVRFSLPEAKLTLLTDKRSVHGTTKYVNGTLINITSTIHTTNNDAVAKSSANGIQLKASCLKFNGNGKDATQYKLAMRPASSAVNGSKDLTIQGPRHSLPSTTSIMNGCRRRGSKSLVIARTDKFNTLPIIEHSIVRDALERKSSSLDDDDFDEDIEVRRDEKDIEQKMMNGTNLTKYKSSDDLRDPSSFKTKSSSVLKLPEANGHGKGLMVGNCLRVPDFDDSK